MASAFSVVSNADLVKLFLCPCQPVILPLFCDKKNWIWKGTTIMSDCWHAYDCLSSEGLMHQRVNHSQNFVYPTSGAHTQNIEHFWHEVRGGIPHFGLSEKNMWLAILRNSCLNENLPTISTAFMLSLLQQQNYICCN